LALSPASSVVVTDAQDAQKAMAGAEYVPGLPALTVGRFIDSAAILVACAKRVLYLVVTTPLAWATPGQPTWQPYVGRTAMAAANGAASQIDNQHFLLGAPQNLGPAAATAIANQAFRLDPGAIAALAYSDPYVGIEIIFPSILSAGVFAFYIESAT
jgi:hypothetical protein